MGAALCTFWAVYVSFSLNTVVKHFKIQCCWYWFVLDILGRKYGRSVKQFCKKQGCKIYFQMFKILQDGLKDFSLIKSAVHLVKIHVS